MRSPSRPEAETSIALHEAESDSASLPPASSLPLLATRNLALRVGSRALVEGLSLQVGAGELWCLIGANGSGKTTLLHALAGLRQPDAGEVLLMGRPLQAWPLEEAALHRGLLPQNLHDAFSARALDVVLMGRHPHLARWALEGQRDMQIARDALHAVDMAEMAGRDVLTLSGGERQRVGIAALLAQQPSVLLLDEPVAHLDLRHQLVVLEHLSRLAREQRKGVLLAIHDLNLAHRFATHALVLGAGLQACCGRVDDVMNEATLGRAFGHPVATVRNGAQTLFVAA